MRVLVTGGAGDSLMHTVASSVEGPAAPTGRRSQYLTVQALRFLAAFAVVVLHCGFYTAERLDSSLGLWVAGANGVRLFFVISGFVMIMAADDRLTAPGAWSVFAVKRIIRIVPMYWAATGFKLVAMLAVPGAALHARFDWSYLAKSLCFIPAYNIDGEIRPLLGVGWTLTFEMFFYVLFMLALVFRANPLRFLAPILLTLALVSPLRTPGWPVALQCWADPIVLDFLVGMLLARWCQAGGALPRGLAVAVMLVGLTYLFAPLGALQPVYNSFLGSILITLAALAVLAGAVSLEPLIGRRIPRFAIFMGAASYALYIVHPLVGPTVPVLLRKFGLIWPYISVICAVCIAMAAGVLGHLLIEKPSTHILTRWARQLGLLDRSAPLPTAVNIAEIDPMSSSAVPRQAGDGRA